MIFLSMSNNLLLTIVLSFVVFDHVQTEAVDDELTTKQLQGRWYDMGKISNCADDLGQQCISFEIYRDNEYEGFFQQFRLPIHVVSTCEYGVPYFTSVVTGVLNGSHVNTAEDVLNPAFSCTAKKYNNGTELIFTDLGSETCGSKSYRLWSRFPKVSAETKAEFEKLATNLNVKYHAWDHCPKLRHQIDDESTLKQIEGLWYGIAIIYNGDPDNDTCITHDFKMNYKNQTFDLVETSLTHGQLSTIIRKGGIFDSVMELKLSRDVDGTDEILTMSSVNCNNGTDKIILLGHYPGYALISRNSKVSAETMSEFKKLSTNILDAHYTIYPQDNCPNRPINFPK